MVGKMLDRSLLDSRFGMAQLIAVEGIRIQNVEPSHLGCNWVLKPLDESEWEQPDPYQRPSRPRRDALNQLSYAPKTYTGHKEQAPQLALEGLRLCVWDVLDSNQ